MAVYTRPHVYTRIYTQIELMSVAQVLRALDHNSSGSLSPAEFMHGMMSFKVKLSKVAQHFCF